MEQTIYVVGYIDSFSLACLVMDFEATPKEADINIVICSGGGSVTAGNAMQAIIINECEKRGADKVSGLIIGECSSIATIISTAIPKGKLKIANSATFMIHSVRVSGDDDVYQTAEQLREMADVMDKFNANLANQLALRSGKPLDYIKATYFDGKDHYLSAAEAVSEGFCDEVITMEQPIEEPEIEDLRIRKFVNKEERLKLAAVLTNKKSVTPKNVVNKMESLTAEKEPQKVSNDAQVTALLSDLQKAQDAIRESNSNYTLVSSQLMAVNNELTEAKEQLANIGNVHKVELAELNSKLQYAQTQLEEVRNESELSKYLNIEAFALGIPANEIGKFIDDQLMAIKGGYAKTPEGYVFKAENKVIGSNAEQTVKHRISIYRSFQPVQRFTNQGSGYNPNNTNSTHAFVGSQNNDLAKKRSDLLALAARQNVAYGSDRFKELCNQNGLEVF